MHRRTRMTTVRPGFSLRNLLIFAALPLFAVATILLKIPAQSQQLAATYRQGKLSVTIPYASPREGSGKLTVEVLDPEDHSLGRVERHVEIRKGSGDWQETISFAQPTSFEEILWQRLRYRFEFDDGALSAIEGIESVSQIISRPVVHILADNEYIAGSQAAIRVIVSEANSNAAQTGAVHIDLLVPDHDPQRLFSGNLNRRGTVEASFRFPAGLTGSYQLRFEADTPIGSTDYTLPIKLEDRASILLTTEKPIYQPGQTIHIRALAMDRAAGH